MQKSPETTALKQHTATIMNTLAASQLTQAIKLSIYTVVQKRWSFISDCKGCQLSTNLHNFCISFGRNWMLNDVCCKCVRTLLGNNWKRQFDSWIANICASQMASANMSRLSWHHQLATVKTVSNETHVLFSTFISCTVSVRLWVTVALAVG